MRKTLLILAVFLVLAILPACAQPTVLPFVASATVTPGAIVGRTATPRPTFKPGPSQATRTPAIPNPTFEPLPTSTSTRVSLPSTGGQHLRVLHQSGQTFLTWDEVPGDAARYRVFRSDSPIQTGQEENLNLLAEIGQGSGNFYTDRFHNPSSHLWDVRFFNRLVITEGGEELPDGQGLLAWTVSSDDLGGAKTGQGFYAVSVLLPDGSERVLPGYTLGPVDESVADPLPVETRVQAGNRSHILIQYMDLHGWNASFHAPNAGNEYYGLHPTDPRFDSTLQYAFDYAVYEPSCAEAVENVPVVLILDDYTRSRPGLPDPDPDMLGWCAYKIYPFDTGDTRWFGFAAFHDYRQSASIDPGDAVSNFTEQRVLRMIYDLMRRPYGVSVDLNRIYVIGRGSGGTAAINLAARFGNVFAAAFANAPLAELGYFDAVSNRKQINLLTGGLDLPILSSAPGIWADSLRQDESAGNGGGTKDLPVFLRSTWLSAAPLGIQYDSRSPAWRNRDGTLETLSKTLQAWSGAVTSPSTAFPQDYRALRPNYQLDSAGLPFYGLRARKNEAILAFSNNQTDQDGWIGGYSGYRQSILWSSSWQPWYGSGPLDLIDRLEFHLCAVDPAKEGEARCGTGWEQVVNITPRRLQHFLVVPGMHIRWQNVSTETGQVFNSGRVTVREDGTFTLNGVLVVPGGNRLVMVQDPEIKSDLQPSAQDRRER